MITVVHSVKRAHVIDPLKRKTLHSMCTAHTWQNFDHRANKSTPMTSASGFLSPEREERGALTSTHIRDLLELQYMSLNLEFTRPGCFLCSTIIEARPVHAGHPCLCMTFAHG